jgi:hypothetical protein
VPRTVESLDEDTGYPGVTEPVVNGADTPWEKEMSPTTSGEHEKYGGSFRKV